MPCLLIFGLLITSESHRFLINTKPNTPFFKIKLPFGTNKGFLMPTFFFYSLVLQKTICILVFFKKSQKPICWSEEPFPVLHFHSFSQLKNTTEANWFFIKKKGYLKVLFLEWRAINNAYVVTLKYFSSGFRWN